MIKIIEALILQDLKLTLVPMICPAQTGFILEYSTQTHIIRLIGKVIDYKKSKTFNTGRWKILFIDFKTAFDRVDHKQLMNKLEKTELKQDTLNVIKLLYNSYRFTLPGGEPQRINSGVVQGSLISPILYCWYVNDLVASLSKKFGDDHTFAYADDIALLCLGNSEVREALSITESWAITNNALLNKKKCSVLCITKRETKSGMKDIDGVPIVKEYKYLGVPLDQSFTLKYLVQLIKGRLKSFLTRIHLLPRSVIGTETKLNLWSCYARCHFEYFAPAMMLCDQINKFSSMYTKSLKKTLDLPISTPNEPILRAISVPSLKQIAAHHLIKNLSQIKKIFQTSPIILNQIVEDLKQKGDEYTKLRKANSVTHIERNNYSIDLLAHRNHLDRCYLGLITGNFLTFRSKGEQHGTKNEIRKCPICATLATQEHFLNECPCNSIPRTTLSSSIPNKYKIFHLNNGNVQLFYRDLRNLVMQIEDNYEGKNPFSENYSINWHKQPPQ